MLMQVGRRILFVAVLAGSKDCVAMLLERGADVDGVDQVGSTYTMGLAAGQQHKQPATSLCL